MQIPKWLARDEGPIGPIGQVCPGAVGLSTEGNQAMPETNGGVDLSAVPPRDILQQAAVLANQYETDKAQWGQMIEQATSRIKDLAREIEFLRLELAEKTNNLQAAQATIEELRQDNSELRALHGALHAQAKHLVVQYENFHIPLPMRKRAKNGKPETGVRGGYQAPEGGEKPALPTIGSGVSQP